MEIFKADSENSRQHFRKKLKQNEFRNPHNLIPYRYFKQETSKSEYRYDYNKLTQTFRFPDVLYNKLSTGLYE